jgi:hypothetical protein
MMLWKISKYNRRIEQFARFMNWKVSQVQTCSIDEQRMFCMIEENIDFDINKCIDIKSESEIITSISLN